MQTLHDNLLNTCSSLLHICQHHSLLTFYIVFNSIFPSTQTSKTTTKMAELYPTSTTETQQQPKSHQVVKACTAVTAGGSLLLLSGLTLAGTVIALTVATPLLVIFSPVLVPAVITVGLIIAGFFASGGFGVAAITVLSWIYRYVTGRHPPGADQLEQARHKLAGKAREMREKAEYYGQQYTGST